MDIVNVLANLTEEEAIAIYKQGQEAVVFKLLELAKAVQERDLLISKLTNGKVPTSLSNERLTCFVIDRSRGSPALKKFFGDIFEGVLITDFWRVYDKISRYRQACFVHFFREIAAITKIRGHNPISTIVHALSHFIEKGELPELPAPILQKAKQLQ